LIQLFRQEEESPTDTNRLETRHHRHLASYDVQQVRSGDPEILRSLLQI
jgi:hypothetical protein